jgi:hypothetical protein
MATAIAIGLRARLNMVVMVFVSCVTDHKLGSALFELFIEER